MLIAADPGTIAVLRTDMVVGVNCLRQGDHSTDLSLHRRARPRGRFPN